MGDLDDAIGVLSPEDRAKWAAQFGALPSQQNAPAIQAPPDNPPPPIDASAQADNQQDWNKQTQGQPQPQAVAPSAQFAPVVSGLSPQERAMWMQRFGRLPQYSSELTPEIRAGQERGQPRELERIDQGDRAEPMTTRPGNPLGEGGLTPEEQARYTAQRDKLAVPVSAHDEENAKRLQSGRPTLEEERRNELRKQLEKDFTEAKRKDPKLTHDEFIKKYWEKQIADEKAVRALTPEEQARYTAQRDKLAVPVSAHDEENAKRLQSGRPTLEEERRNELRKQLAAQGAPSAHVMANFAVPGYDDAAPDPTNPPRDPYAGLRSSQVNQKVDPLQAQIQAEKERGQSPEDIAANQEYIDKQNNPPPFDVDARDKYREQEPEPERTQTLPETTITGDVDRLTHNEPTYSPARYIPGQRTPAAWSVREGQPVSEEDQGRLAEARAGQQGAIEAGRMAAVEKAEQEARDKQNQLDAQAKIDAENRQRQLDRQRALQVHVDKLGAITKAVQGRSLDDEQMFALPGAAGSFFSAIGQALGAGAAARLGGVNHAAEYVKGRINQIVQRQKMQADKDKNLLDTEGNLVAQMRKQFGDDELGDQAAKIAYLERAKLAADQHAKETSVGGLNANATALSADLDASNAKEKIAFDQMAKDQVMRRDVMTKGQMVGGAPAGSGSGEEAEPERVVRLGDYSLAGHPANTDLVLGSKTDRKEAIAVISAHSAIKSALNEMRGLVEEHPWLTYGNIDLPVIGHVASTKEYKRYMKLVETVTTNQGELRGQTRMPNQAELERMFSLWGVGPANSLGGAGIKEIADQADAEADRIAAARIKTMAPNIAERGLGYNEHGEVRPVETYTGGAMYTHPMPPGAKRVSGTSGGAGPRDIAPLDMTHPKKRIIHTHISKGGKRTETSEPAADEGDEGDGG